MRAKTILLLLIALLFTSVVSAQTRYPKREFRGAWIQCVNGQFQGMPAEKMQQVLTFLSLNILPPQSAALSQVSAVCFM